jgi:predicted component of viral defense system (DUF524 family)
MESKKSVQIDLGHIEPGLILTIDARQDNTLFYAQDALDHNEAFYQIIEGYFYDYEFSIESYRFLPSIVVHPHSRKGYIGTISPNIYVGTLCLPIFFKEAEIGEVRIEVQSIKTGYRDDYRDMLEYITVKCTDLLMQANSPVSQHFESDYTANNKPESLYQKFAFVSSILNSDEFIESIHRVLAAPATKWQEYAQKIDIRKASRLKRTNVKQLTSERNRVALPLDHHLAIEGIFSLPRKITEINKFDSLDTPENRFVKHVLTVFTKFCSDINRKAEPKSRLLKESNLLVKSLESYLSHSFFKKISPPETLKINSPILQRKEGYREILRSWLMFDLAAKLIWKGGDDVYDGGKKDVALLYEYWIFFVLLDLFQGIFNINAKSLSELIQVTEDGLNLVIKEGNHVALEGVYNGIRNLNVRFSYNRSFRGKSQYPKSGSWTLPLRPDYSLSLWPLGVSEAEAEAQELIVHLHFDAKYKIETSLQSLLEQRDGYEEIENLNEEKRQNRQGIYKNADLLKMHAYKDAIRRTGGAYILYPGDKSIKHIGFHEIIPGLGAFPLRPSKTDIGISDLKSFIYELIDHFNNRASQREKLAFRVFDIYKDKYPNVLNEKIPEAHGNNRELIPDETFVLIGFYKSAEQYNWIIKQGLYNYRTGLDRGSLILDKETIGAKYLLLHTYKQPITNDIWRITSRGPKVLLKNDLIQKGYPSPGHDHYLVYEIEKVGLEDFNCGRWDLSKLSNYHLARGSALPFVVSMTDLMAAKI